jgi:hypothetical protein
MANSELTNSPRKSTNVWSVDSIIVKRDVAQGCPNQHGYHPPNVGMTTMCLLGASSCHRRWYGQKLLTTIMCKIEGRVVRQASKNGRPKIIEGMVHA